MKQRPNIDYIMEMTKDYIDGKIDIIDYSLDFSYEMKQRINAMDDEDRDYSDLIYEELLIGGVDHAWDMEDEEFRKLMRKQYNKVKRIVREGFW